MPGPLLTPNAAIAAAGVGQLARYYDIIPLGDAAGFSAKRHYPEATPLAELKTRSGIRNYAVLIHFALRPPTAEKGIQRVELAARLHGVWEERHGADLYSYDYSHADCPTPEAVRVARRLRPLALDFPGDFYYDAADGRFYAEEGPVTVEGMLDFVYETHCHTLRRFFRLRWAILEQTRNAVQKLVWNTEKVALWLLEHGYEVVPNIGDKYGPGPFHRYKLTEFQRASDTSGTHFFGFRSSNRSLFSNIMLLGLACVFVFHFARQHPLAQAIYGNTALTTVALVFGFLLADQAAPFLLKVAVSLLSRLKFRTLFVRRMVTGIPHKPAVGRHRGT
jgi:hypothetical protein